jgi:molecular chaperone GrpE
MTNVCFIDNFRRRTQVEKKDWSNYAIEKLVISVAEVLDNFERACQQVPEDAVDNPFVKGMLQIESQLANVLKKEGVEKIQAQDEMFDPQVHEAIAHVPSQAEENCIVAVIQNGYTLQGKVIRPARVAVSNGISPDTKSNENEDNNGGNNG